VASCAHCGATLPKESRYCSQCGNRSDAGGTKVMELPPDETGHVPVHYRQAETRYYGVTPATLVLVLAGAALTLAVVLLALGRWPLGLVLLGVAVLLALVSLEAARRKPAGAVARSPAQALDAFRTRAGAATESLATRGRAARRLIALRRSSAALAYGGIRFAFVDEDVIAYLRESPGERLLCLASRDEHEPVRLPLGALESRGLESLYGAEAETAAGDVLLPATGPSFHVWRLTNG